MEDQVKDAQRSKVELLACAAHMANRAYCFGLGDTSQPTWESAPEWQKASARAGVRAALDPAQTPEKSHESWMAQKAAEGWTWGPKKDPDLKTHPCMVSYDQLPESQRLKDTLFLTVVRSMILKPYRRILAYLVSLPPDLLVGWPVVLARWGRSVG